MGKLIPLKFVPGINRDSTSFGAEGSWWDCDKIRFNSGFPETIGGWTQRNETEFLGTCRALYAWVTLSNNVLFGVGTNKKYYVEEGAGLYDVTPIRVTTAAGDVTFSATNGDATITVTDVDHGALLGDYVTYSGAVTLGGNITADILNAEHEITAIIDEDTYEIEASVAANASDTGNGGASVVGEYQINTGIDSAILGTGWGAGGWGDGGWGVSASVAAGEASTIGTPRRASLAGLPISPTSQALPARRSLHRASSCPTKTGM